MGFLTEVIEAKNYQDAKRMTDAADTKEKRQTLPTTKMFQLVSEIDMELAAEGLERRKVQANG